jgi:hypothetical protein
MLKWVLFLWAQNLRTFNSTSIEALCLATSPKHGQEDQVAARPPTLAHDKFLNHSAARTRAYKFPKQILLCSLQHSNYLISPIDLPCDLPFSYMLSCHLLVVHQHHPDWWQSGMAYYLNPV